MCERAGDQQAAELCRMLKPFFKKKGKKHRMAWCWKRKGAHRDLSTIAALQLALRVWSKAEEAEENQDRDGETTSPPGQTSKTGAASTKRPWIDGNGRK